MVGSRMLSPNAVASFWTVNHQRVDRTVAETPAFPPNTTACIRYSTPACLWTAKCSISVKRSTSASTLTEYTPSLDLTVAEGVVLG